MKQTNKCLIAAIASLASTSLTQAAVTLGGPPAGSAFYVWEGTVTVTNSSVASTSTTINPGGWSYDNTGTVATVGWGHTSSWFLIEVQEAAYFTLSMTATTIDLTQREAARPGFVLYGGSANDDDADGVHQYSNDGADMSLNDTWDLAPKLTYVTHGVNNSGNSLSQGVALTPGLYTLVMGNSASASLTPGTPQYSVTFAVPEPSAALLSLAGGLLAIMRRRR